MCKSQDTTLLFKCTVQKYIYPSVSCCCSVPQLNTLRVTQYVYPPRTCTSTGTVHRVRGFRVRPFLMTPPCRQPHSVFGGASVQAGSFRVSVIHRTLTWTTGSLTCVRDHSYACVHTRGLAHSLLSVLSLSIPLYTGQRMG